jgi:hypothetical protein
MNMSEDNVVVKTALDAEKVKKAIDLILKIADSMTKMIPGDVDDKVVYIFKQFAEQPWFADLVVTLIEAFGPGTPVNKEKATELVAAALATHSK